LLKAGIEGASIARIAGNLGINPSLIIHHFNTKDELAIALLEHFIEKFETEFLARRDEESEPAAKLDFLINRVIFPSPADPQTNRVLSVLLALKYMASRQEKTALRVVRLIARFRARVIQSLSDCLQAGLIKPSGLNEVVELLITLNFGYLDRCQFQEFSEREFEDFRNSLIRFVMQTLNAEGYR